MDLIRRIRKLYVRQLKHASRSRPHALGWGEERIERPRHYQASVQEGYAQNPIVYRAVTLIARSVASVPWMIHGKGHRLTQHPLLTVLNSPNPWQGGAGLIESVVSYLLLAGNSYLQAITTSTGQPLEIHTLRPDRMTLTLDRQGLLTGYQYKGSGHEHVGFPYEPDAAKNEILHVRLFHPLQETYGMSPLEAASLAIDQHNAVAQHNLSLLENGGRPTGALMIKHGSAQPFQLTPEQRHDLKQQVQETFSGSRNAGKVLVLEGNMEWKEMGASLKDSDYVEGKHLSAREIAQVFGVPPILVGVPGDATFANYREARLHFWEDTVLPLLETLTCELNRWLAPRYGRDVQLGYDTDAIPALSPKREIVWGKIAKAHFLTLNEKRQAIGYPPLPGGDRFESPLRHDTMGAVSQED